MNIPATNGAPPSTAATAVRPAGKSAADPAAPATAAQPSTQTAAHRPVNAAVVGTTAKTLSKLGNGEYTAASVRADPKDAQAMGLVKQKDGNYAAKAVAPDTAPKSAAAMSSPAVQDALSSLTLGG